ncbi:MAG: hypothetical protein ACYTEQ_24600, partial [Planctomycetota bacterium]
MIRRRNQKHHTHSAGFSCSGCHGNCDTSPPPGIISGTPDYVSAGPGGINIKSWYVEYNSIPVGEADCANINHSNSHIEHIVNGGFKCTTCHYDTITDMGVYHFNGSIDLTSEGDIYNFQYDFRNSKKRCFQSCHGEYDKIDPIEVALAPQWGGNPGPPPPGRGSGCLFCHGGPEDPDVPRPVETADAMPNRIDGIQYESNGHGATTPYASGNPGAGYDDYTDSQTSPGCYSTSGNDAQLADGCHYEPSAHFPTKSDADPYRLGDYFADTGSDGRIDELCLYCHAEGQSGSALEAMTHSAAVTGSSLDWDAGTGYDRNSVAIGDNTWGSNEPKCVDCHDPHGDSNDYMVKNSVSRIYGGTDYGSPRLDPADHGGDDNVPNYITQPLYNIDLMAPVAFSLTTGGQAGDYYDLVSDGICQVCHTQTSVFNNLASGPLSPHGFITIDGAVCTTCHAHIDGFKASCEGCHGSCSPNFSGEPLYGAPDYPSAAAGTMPGMCIRCHSPNPSGHIGGCSTSVNSNSHALHLTNGGLTCADCHIQTITDTDPTDGWSLLAGGKHMAPLHSIQVFSGEPEYTNFSPTDWPVGYTDFGNKRCFRSCHGMYAQAEELLAPQWGGEMGDGCFICHDGAEAPDAPRPVETADGSPNIVDQFQYESNGHGATTPYNSGNPGAGYDDITGSGTLPGCYSTSGSYTQPVDGCHYKPAKHFPTKAPTDPYRLGNYFADAGADDRIDELCLYCHGIGQSGSEFAKEVRTHSEAVTGSSLDWDAGIGYDRNGVAIGDNTWGSNEPKCVDCHDPHGDDNDYMVKNSISRIYGSTAYGSPRLDPADHGGGINIPNYITQPLYDEDLMELVAFGLISGGRAGDYYNLLGEGLDDGVCQICHTQTAVFNSLATGSVDPHDLMTIDNAKCTACHKHINGFKASCDDCHGYPPNDPQHTTHATNYEFTCYTCHYRFNDMTVNTSGHPSQQFIDTGSMNTVFINFPSPQAAEQFWFPGGTRITSGAATPYTQNPFVEVTCNVGCHSPIIALPDGLARDRGITVAWQADSGNVACADCHDDIGSKFSDTATRSSKHPADPNINGDCLICHDFYKPDAKVTISEGEAYHTNYKLTAEEAPAWPQVTWPLLLDRDTSSFVPYKLNVTESAGVYTFTGDSGYKDNMTSYCLACHDGDDSSAPVFSLGGGAPNIERNTFWDDSAHATGGATSVQLGCFGDPVMDSSVAGCHANAHG